MSTLTDPHARGHLVRELFPNRATLTVDEAGRVLGVSRNSAYEAARRGEIPTIRLGRRLIVPVAQLERLLAGEGTDD